MICINHHLITFILGINRSHNLRSTCGKDPGQDVSIRQALFPLTSRAYITFKLQSPHLHIHVLDQDVCEVHLLTLNNLVNHLNVVMDQLCLRSQFWSDALYEG